MKTIALNLSKEPKGTSRKTQPHPVTTNYMHGPPNEESGKVW